MGIQTVMTTRMRSVRKLTHVLIHSTGFYLNSTDLVFQYIEKLKPIFWFEGDIGQFLALFFSSPHT